MWKFSTNTYFGIYSPSTSILLPLNKRWNSIRPIVPRWLLEQRFFRHHKYYVRPLSETYPNLWDKWIRWFQFPSRNGSIAYLLYGAVWLIKSSRYWWWIGRSVSSYFRVTRYQLTHHTSPLRNHVWKFSTHFKLVLPTVVGVPYFV